MSITQTYTITGMTCGGCVASVNSYLSNIQGVSNAEVSLERKEAVVTMEHTVGLATFKEALPEKYTITIKNAANDFTELATSAITTNEEASSKLQQLKPLLLIFTYLFFAVFLMHYKQWNIGEAMLDFMGLFYIVFSFFKFLDLKGFPKSFGMYDPLAKAVPVYGKIYPFLELGLGLLFLMRIEIVFALIATIVVLGITTAGVVRTLLDKKKIQCACLGTALKLPMTEATFIENTIMLIMAVAMLSQLFLN